MPGRFKPRMRFDRVYMRQATPPVITPRHFGLLGLEKAPGTQSFPSDHWGIIVHFEVQHCLYFFFHNWYILMHFGVLMQLVLPYSLTKRG